MNFRILKQTIYRLLRKAHLLGIVDYLWFVRAALRAKEQNTQFLKSNPAIQVPPLHILFDALHNCSYRDWYVSGITDAKRILATIRSRKPTESLAILEWGCGPARVIQHLRAIDPNLSRIIGSDYNATTIEWCKSSLEGIEFLLNGLQPPLPMGNQSVDAVYAISVFTHLSEAMHQAWIEEMLRILRPGGILVLTLHGEKKRNYLLPDELTAFDHGKLVVRKNVQEGKKHYLAYHSPRFVRDSLLARFCNIEHVDAPEMHQDIWIATAP